MAQDKEKIYKSIPQHQIDELTAIYDDYLFIARQHENVFNTSSIKKLEREQKEIMRPADPGAWQVTFMTPKDKQDFEDFINDNVFEDDTRTYITLKHIKPEDDNGYRKVFAVPPYRFTSVNMQLPSSLERCSIVYPEKGTMGNTTFFIDGLYKAIYIGPTNHNKPLSEFAHDEDIISEFYILMRLTEALRKNNYVDDDKFKKSSQNVYASERVVINENVILELLGSFAGKVIEICHELYVGYKPHYSALDNVYALEQAEREGLIPSAADFLDYVNIRNFLRHQWDTLDELGSFDPKESRKNKFTRTGYVNSYLKLCDKSPEERAKSYIDILHQMQHVIKTINPNRIIRHQDENNKNFMERVIDKFISNPNDNLRIELNYPLSHKKCRVLIQYVAMILPHTKIVDYYPVETDNYTKINDYIFRSYFLQTFTATECMVMRHCLIRGCNKKSKDSWEYMRKIGFFSSEEAKKWKTYLHVRHMLSHNYYNDTLRKQLCSYEDVYKKDLEAIIEKFTKNSPDVTKLKPGVYEYKHVDGLVVHLDHNYHTVLYRGIDTGTQIQETPKTTIDKKQNKPYKEVCPNGVEFNISGTEITSVKLPIGITINLNLHRIDWDGYMYWTTNTDQFHTLKTENSKLIINKFLRVTEYKERNNHIPIQASDCWLLDNRHNFYLDSRCNIYKLKFKKAKNQIIQTDFIYTPEGYNALIFSDGTIILLANQHMLVRHGGKILSFDNRNEFADTYITPQNILKNSNNKVH